MIAVPASPALAVSSIIYLDPGDGQINDWVRVDGKVYPLGGESSVGYVDIYFTSEFAQTGYDIRGEVEVYYKALTHLEMDISQFFEGDFRVPARLNDGDGDEAVTGGTYYVCATLEGSTDIKAVAPFTVTDIPAEISLSTNDGVVGTEVGITGEDFAEEEEITIYYDGNELDSDYIVECDDDGETDSHGDMGCTIIIPPSASGDHTILVTDESISAAEAEFSVDSSAAVSPTHTPPGDTAEISGTGFDSEEDVTITIDGEEVATEETDNDGSFTVSFTVPELDEGTYDIEVDDGSNTVDLEFTVDIGTEASVTPATSQASPGWVGQNITMTGSGFDANTAITISYASTPQVVATTTSDANGDFIANFNIPPSAGGAHTLTASDGSNTMTVPFYIEAEKPAIPTPLIPEDGGKAPARASFDWGDVTDPSPPVTYTLQIASDEAFSNILLEAAGLPLSEYTLPEGTELPKTTEESPYHWRVRATDAAANVGDWSAPDSFHVGGFSFPGVGGGWLIHLWWGLGVTGAVFLGYWLGKRRAYYY